MLEKIANNISKFILIICCVSTRWILAPVYLVIATICALLSFIKELLNIFLDKLSRVNY